MTLWLIVLVPLTFAVAGWAWRYQHQVLSITGTGLAQIVGRPGTVADVQLTSLLVDEPTVLIGLQPAGMAPQRPGRPMGPSSRLPLHLLMCLDTDPQAGIARLRRWQASGAPVVMWRDLGGYRVELSNSHSGQQIALTVITDPLTKVPSRR
jgi:hypothetical protein